MTDSREAVRLRSSQAPAGAKRPPPPKSGPPRRFRFGPGRAVSAATLVILTVLIGQIALVSAPTEQRSVPIAVYRGAGEEGLRRIATYEGFLGRRVEYAIEYQDVDTEENQTWPDWQATVWRDSGRRLVIGSTGIGPEDGFSWKAAAAGVYEEQWRTFGERLVATGQANAILRGAHEFNGDWFFYQVHPGEQDLFVTAWRRWVDILRSVPGNAFTFDWNPIVGKDAVLDATTAYPGDAYVDRIAIDIYDGWYDAGFRAGVDPEPDQAARDAVWDELLDGSRGLRFWRSFAEQRGKPLSLPEWGIRTWVEDDGLVHGGGDNESFVQRMAAIIADPEWNVAYHGFWENPADGGSGVAEPDSGRAVPVPRSRAAYLELFGS